MKKKRVLFICNLNRLRSPSAQALYEGHDRVEARSAGLGMGAITPATEELLHWADKVFVMERRHRDIIHKRWPELYASRKIICLHIPDKYEFMDPTLLQILTRKLGKYLGKPSMDLETS